MARDSDLASETTGPTLARRLQRRAAAVVAPVLAILLPDRVRAEVTAGRYAWPLMIVVLSAGLAALAIGARLDLGPEVRAENAAARPTPAATTAGADRVTPAVKTDRELDEETAQRTAVTRVMLGLDAGLKTPARVLVLALMIFLLGRYVGGTPTMPRALTAAALVALPGAVRAGVTAVAAWHQPSLRSADLGGLLSSAALPVPPGHPVLARLLGGVDVFTCWAIVIFAVALAAAADLKRTKAVVTSAVAVVLYLLVTGLIMGGGGPPPGAGS